MNDLCIGDTFLWELGKHLFTKNREHIRTIVQKGQRSGRRKKEEKSVYWGYICVGIEQALVHEKQGTHPHNSAKGAARTYCYQEEEKKKKKSLYIGDTFV